MLKKILFGLAVGWTLLIAFLCLVPLNKLPSFGVSGTDKYVHAILHFVFTFFWGSYFSVKQNEIRMPKILRVVMLSIFYGIMIEILQGAFTTKRHSDILDVLANLSGTLLALVLFILIKMNKLNQP